MRNALLMIVTISALTMSPAVAQEGTPVHVRGAVERLDGQTLVVKSREGEIVSIALGPDVKINAVVAAKLSDIKAGDFIGSAALPGTDGTLHAQEVLIFPETARGTGEGHRPWDLTPGSTMTNATVAEVVEQTNGRLLRLKYKDGAKDLDVPPDAPVVTLAPGDASLLQPGNGVIVLATKKPDGTLTANVVVAGKDGVNPPM